MLVVQGVHPSEVNVNRLASIRTWAADTVHHPKAGVGLGLALSAVAGAPMPLPQLALVGPWIAACAAGAAGARAAAAVGFVSYLVFAHPGLVQMAAAAVVALAMAFGIPMLMNRPSEPRRSSDEGASAVVVDCEGFSSLDDSYGPGASDHVFKMLRRALETETRSTDLVVHAQGQELILVLEGSSPEVARAVMERVERRFSSWLQDAGYECNLSVGLSNMDNDEEEFDALMRAARRADGEPYLD
ncbi:diguanylate cyclase [bacterium]|nr:MAG: diguanylate cyclase [bacterium]